MPNYSSHIYPPIAQVILTSHPYSIQTKNWKIKTSESPLHIKKSSNRISIHVYVISMSTKSISSAKISAYCDSCVVISTKRERFIRLVWWWWGGWVWCGNVNLPALKKSDAMLISILDGFRGIKFYYLRVGWMLLTLTEAFHICWRKMVDAFPRGPTQLFVWIFTCNLQLDMSACTHVCRTILGAIVYGI